MLYPLYDCHAHSFYSHDCRTDPTDLLRQANAKGLAGFAVTDHCDSGLAHRQNVIAPVLLSNRCVRALDAGIMAGVEIGEAEWFPEVAQSILTAGNYDVVIGSLHAVRYKDTDEFFSVIDFSGYTPEDIHGYLTAYFTQLLRLAQVADYDIFAHITVPLRYICGKYGRPVSLSPYAGQIEAVLKAVIQRDKVLEVNTSNLGSAYNELMPTRDILREYRRLGGQKISLGSDAHKPHRIGHCFDETADCLNQLGFTQAYRFQNRNQIPYDLP